MTHFADNASSPTPRALWSRPEEEREGTPLLVLLHGYGSNAEDLMGLEPLLPEGLTVASLQAPQQLAPGAYQWFPLSSSLDFSLEAVREACDGALAWLDEVSSRHSSVALLGFSMGMAMATTMVRRRPDAFAAVIGLSGFAIDPGEDDGAAYFRDDELDGTVPMFWGRDQADPVIPESKIDYTLGWVRGRVKLSKVTYQGIGHSISQSEAAHVREFLELHLKLGHGIERVRP